MRMHTTSDISTTMYQAVSCVKHYELVHLSLRNCLLLFCSYIERYYQVEVIAYVAETFESLVGMYPTLQ